MTHLDDKSMYNPIVEIDDTNQVVIINFEYEMFNSLRNKCFKNKLSMAEAISKAMLMLATSDYEEKETQEPSIKTQLEFVQHQIDTLVSSRNQQLAAIEGLQLKFKAVTVHRAKINGVENWIVDFQKKWNTVLDEFSQNRLTTFSLCENVLHINDALQEIINNSAVITDDDELVNAPKNDNTSNEQ